MATTTARLGLTKPADTDGADEIPFSDNMQKIDDQVAQQVDLEAHTGAEQGVHGTGTGYVAKTTRADHLPDWGDLQDIPAFYPPSAHASSHKTGGGDPLAPADIGAETPAGAQAKADTNLEESLVIQGAYPVTGEEPAQVDVATYGPAIEFADGVTQSISFNLRWPFATANATITLELVMAMDTANAGGARLQAVSYVNGAAAATTPWTVIPGSVTTLVTVTQAIRAAASVAHGALLTIKLSRLGGDAADTHTGKLRLFQTRVKRG